MAISFKHAFTSAKIDGGDSTLIQPSNWNAEHVLTLASGKVLGRDSSGAGAAQELNISVDPTGQSMVPPSGDTASRPASPASGMFRYNTTLLKHEGYNGTSWGSIPYEGTAASATFGSIELGNASDTTITRAAPGVAAVEGRAMPYVLAQSAVQIPHPSSSIYQFALITVPGGAMGPNGYIDMYTYWTINSSASGKGLFFKVGGSGGTTIVNSSYTTQPTYFMRRVVFANRGSNTSNVALIPEAEQYGMNPPFSTGPVTTSLDTSVNWDFYLAGTKATGGDTLRLEGYQMLMYYSA
jgi:hypothetical protein